MGDLRTAAQDVVEARFWSKVDHGDGHGVNCWTWQGYVNPKGYGRFVVRRTNVVQAHRYAYESARGPIPGGMVIDHLCRNRRCVNPAHMEPVSNRENVIRGESLPAANLAKRTCPKGHPYAGDNLRVLSRGDRICRICDADRKRRQRRAS